MAQIWRGVVPEYSQYLPEHITNTPVTLGEGGYPLIDAPKIARALESTAGLSPNSLHLLVKFEGRNPTGSFKDRGMTAAISAQKGKGVEVVVCASTGNTSASAAAYATAAGMRCVVLVPDGKIAMGKLAQAIAHGAKVLQIDGNFDDCLRIAQELADNYPVGLVNSVNPDRLEGQKTGAFEVIDELGNAPFIHALPVGNAGNIAAYYKGYREYFELQKAKHIPQMWGFQAEGAAPIVRGEVVANPETIATAIRIGNPASWKLAEEARDASGGLIDAVSDQQILDAHRLLSSEAGIFVEPASAAGLAGLFLKAKSGELKSAVEANGERTAQIVITCTGHGLKDPSWALQNLDGSEKQDVLPIKVSNDTTAVAALL
jgi:threonine synthase